MINAERILLALDRRMEHDLRLVIYGRAAIALGFPDAPAEASRSLDVDVIIPVSETQQLRNDTNFWEAQEAANRELENEGLYITHLFAADQLFLRSNWEQQVLPLLRPATRWLRLFRPATLDLILTKMMRGDDPQDLDDIAFLIQHDQIDSDQIESALAEAVIPDLAELRDAFERAKPLVRQLAKSGNNRER
ncbi:MAG: DUF6036 family nucleotidyltransferase [Verrucomicrobiota bacterium]